jgi:glucokinase
MSAEARYAACCDFGGTKVLVGLVDETGHILGRDRYLLADPREPGRLAAEAASRLNQLVRQAGLSWQAVVGVGCSVAAVLDAERRLIQFAPNLVGPAEHVPFQELLQTAFERPVWLEMDAQATALGEAWQGAGAGAKDLIYVVIGTGIGAGILVRGRIYRGWAGAAGEFGHTTIEPKGHRCNCGNAGCLEALAAGPALARQAQRAIEQGRTSLMQALSVQQPLSAETIMQAARLGDGLAGEIIHQAAEYLGIGLANLLNLLDPEVIVLGGGVIRGGADLLLEPIRQAVMRRCGSWVDWHQHRIVIAALGEDAALLGAARLVWDAIKSGRVVD